MRIQPLRLYRTFFPRHQVHIATTGQHYNGGMRPNSCRRINIELRHIAVFLANGLWSTRRP